MSPPWTPHPIPCTGSDVSLIYFLDPKLAPELETRRTGNDKKETIFTFIKRIHESNPYFLSTHLLELKPINRSPNR